MASLNADREIRKLARTVADLTARLEAQERASQARYRSVEGGAQTVYDTDGTPRQIIGQQPDGTFTTRDLNAPAPVAPSTPIVEERPGLLVITWDGGTEDGTLLPLDFARAEVHLSDVAGAPATDETQVAEFTSQRGGSVTLALDEAAYFVTLTMVNTSGAESLQSVEVSATPLPAATGAGGVNTYSSADAPVGLGVDDDGAIWYDTDNGNLPNRWDGTEWVPMPAGSGAIVDGAVTQAKIVDGAVTSAKIGPGAITQTKITDGAITSPKLSGDAIDGKTITGAVVRTADTGERLTLEEDPATPGSWRFGMISGNTNGDEDYAGGLWANDTSYGTTEYLGAVFSSQAFTADPAHTRAYVGVTTSKDAGDPAYRTLMVLNADEINVQTPGLAKDGLFSVPQPSLFFDDLTIFGRLKMGAIALRASASEIATGANAFTVVPLNVLRDEGGNSMHTANSRIYIDQDGFYIVTGSFRWEIASTGRRSTVIKDEVFLGEIVNAETAASGGYTGHVLSTAVFLRAGAVLHLEIFSPNATSSKNAFTPATLAAVRIS